MFEQNKEQELKTIIEMSLSLAENVSERLAKLYKKMYDDLLNVGFTKEEAIEIVKSYRPIK